MNITITNQAWATALQALGQLAAETRSERYENAHKELLNAALDWSDSFATADLSALLQRQAG